MTSNDIKINGALHHIIEYMQEDDVCEIGESIKHNGKEYYVTIEEIEKHSKKDKRQRIVRKGLFKELFK